MNCELKTQEEGFNIEAVQVHIDCLELRIQDGIIFQKVEDSNYLCGCKKAGTLKGKK